MSSTEEGTEAATPAAGMGGPRPCPGRGARAGRARRIGGPALALGAALLFAAQLPAAAGTGPRPTAGAWTASWEGAPVVGSDGTGTTCPAGQGLTDTTVRNAVFVATGGSRVRVRVTNAFGSTPLTVGHATVAVQGDGAAPVPGSLVPLTFDGARSVTVPPGEELFSDPVELTVRALETLLVSVYTPGPTGPLTGHPFTTNTSFLAAGDATAAGDTAPFRPTPCWLAVAGVDVNAPSPQAGSVVALGDSLTDTAASTGDTNHRWTDDLARRLALSPAPSEEPPLSVVNAGLGGNRLLAERPGQPYYGVAALDRLERDVFEQSGVRTVIVFEGINDIGYDASASEITGAYQKIAGQAHERGLRVVGATLTPFAGSGIWTAARQRTWDDVNTWIRQAGVFDAVLDFAAATGAPDDPRTLDPAYDSGDQLHPNDAGTQAIADSVDPALLTSGTSPGPGGR